MFPMPEFQSHIHWIQSLSTMRCVISAGSHNNKDFLVKEGARDDSSKRKWTNCGKIGHPASNRAVLENFLKPKN